MLEPKNTFVSLAGHRLLHTAARLSLSPVVSGKCRPSQVRTQNAVLVLLLGGGGGACGVMPSPGIGPRKIGGRGSNPKLLNSSLRKFCADAEAAGNVTPATTAAAPQMHSAGETAENLLSFGIQNPGENVCHPCRDLDDED